MNFISNLLAGWSDKFADNKQYEWMGQIFGTVEIVLYVILGLVGAAGAIYAIYLGIQLARAEEQGKRDEAKKHLITVFIAIAVTLVLILFFNLLLPEIVGAFIGPSINDPSGSQSGMIGLANVAKMALHL